MPRAYIGLGSNLGDRLHHISEAVRLISWVTGVRVLRTASVIETEPLGGPAQGLYLNSAAEIETDLSPQELLAATQSVERAVGRTPSPERWAPRAVDLDILLYDDRVVESPGLLIPHPRLHERWFALKPLAMLAPDRVHPLLGRSIQEILDSLPEAVRR